jgi:hypothetical protein
LKAIVINPIASTLIESIRSIGYTFESAVADIIDNSISASATRIDVMLELIHEPSLIILDNGCGMSRDELLEAMRYGSKNPNETRGVSDLGRFGLGLKSASMSQCRRLTVVSKQDKHISSFSWDLDFVYESKEWLVKELDVEEINRLPNMDRLLAYDHGTYVLWQSFDRIKDSSKKLEQALTSLVSNTSEYISLIYHRFTESGIKFYLNEAPIKMLDPFLSSHKATSRRKEQRIIINGETVRIKPFILPHYNHLKNTDIELIGGKNKLKNQQGFYLYRNKRLIIWGTWFRMAAIEELNKLARIQVDIPNSLDYIWSIDVKKSTASLPNKIKNQLVDRVKEAIEGSTRVYRTRTTKEHVDNIPVWNRNRTRDGNIQYNINLASPLIQDLFKSLDNKQQHKVVQILKIVENSFPYDQAYYDQAKDNIYVDHEMNDDLYDYAKNVITFMRNEDESLIDTVHKLATIAPFDKHQGLIDRLIDEVKRNGGL